MISQEVKSMFGDSQLCWMATADATGIPNVAPMKQVWWCDQQRLVIGDLFMHTSAANVRSTGRMCLGAFDPDTTRAWKLVGTATYETEGPCYDLAQAELEKKSPDKQFKGVVVFTVRTVYDQVPGPNAGKLVAEF